MLERQFSVFGVEEVGSNQAPLFDPAMGQLRAQKVEGCGSIFRPNGAEDAIAGDPERAGSRKVSSVSSAKPISLLIPPE
jgi:hypothetical protein